jgi:hypothetical protein
MSPAARRVAQAWIAPLADDPEAESALAVARERLEAGRTLESVRRFRLFELSGPLPPRGEIEEGLHRSIQFYNPAKERCVLRAAESDAVPAGPAEALVLVIERDGDRRPAAERWWRHERGERIEIREGVLWALGFAPGADAAALASSLAAARDRRTGLFANPHFQDHRVVAGERPPLRWIVRPASRGRRRP